MYLHDGDERGVQIVGLCLLGVQDLDWVCAPGDREDWLKHTHNYFSIHVTFKTVTLVMFVYPVPLTDRQREKCFI